MDRSVIMSCGCEAACGQQLRIVGATTSQCQTRPGVPLNAQFFFKGGEFRPAWLKSWHMSGSPKPLPLLG